MDHTPQPGRRRWLPRGRRWVDDPVVRVMVLVYPLIRLVAMVTAAPVNAPDWPTYRGRNGSFLNFSLTSLDGRSVRPWGVTAWMALWPSDRTILLAQVALSIVAWAALAVTVAQGIQNRAGRRLLAFLVLLVSCTAQVMAADAIMLSESVSISTGILALVAAIRFTRAPSWRRGGVLVLAALWFSMTRPNVFPVLLAWAVALVVVGLLRREIRMWGTVAGALVLISAYALVYNVRSDEAWRAVTGVSRTTIAYAYPIAARNPVATEVLADLRNSDAPRCMIPAKPTDVGPLGPTRWAKTTAKVCPGMDAWATANWNRWYLGWLLHHRLETARIVHAELPGALSPPVEAAVSAPAPTFVGSMFFGSPSIPQSNTPDRSYRTQPLLLWLGAILTLAVVGRRRFRDRSWHIDLVVLAGAVGALVSAIAGGLLIPYVAETVGRENTAVALLLTASFIVLVGSGLGRLSSETPTAPPRSGGASTPEVITGRSAVEEELPGTAPADETGAEASREDHPVG